MNMDGRCFMCTTLYTNFIVQCVKEINIIYKVENNSKSGVNLRNKGWNKLITTKCGCNSLVPVQ